MDRSDFICLVNIIIWKPYIYLAEMILFTESKHGRHPRTTIVERSCWCPSKARIRVCFQLYFLTPGGCESLNPSLILEDVFGWTILYLLALAVSSATWCGRVAISDGSPKIFWTAVLCCVWWMSCHHGLSLLIIGALVALAVCSSLDSQSYQASFSPFFRPI